MLRRPYAGNIFEELRITTDLRTASRQLLSDVPCRAGTTYGGTHDDNDIDFAVSANVRHGFSARPPGRGRTGYMRLSRAPDFRAGSPRIYLE